MANEKRLIDANALLEKLSEICKEHFCFRSYQYVREFVGDVADSMREAPTVDAVEVVRCKDCKHYSSDQYGCECGLHSEKENEDYPAFAVQMLPNDFCSYGERKDNV
jgi:hypothetical protein